MATFLECYSELRGHFPKLDVFLSQKLVNRAWQDIQKKRLWSFLISDSALLAPAVVTAGTATVTQYSTSVTMSVAAAAAIAAIPVQTPVTLQQFRLPSGPVYSITAWDGVNTLTLDRVYAEASAASTGYQVYQCYYPAPGATIVGDTKFRKWLSVYDPINAYWFKSTNKSSQDFDKWDPQRSDYSNPYYLGYYKVVNGVKLYEMWPHPLENIGYRCKWLSGYSLFTRDSDTLPQTISDTLLMERAMMHGCEWAAKMAGTYRELAGTNWNAEKSNHLAVYLELLRDAQNEDEDSFSTMIIPSSVPLDEGHPETSQWWQEHDGSFFWEP